jgi:hypothetical protein
MPILIGPLYRQSGPGIRSIPLDITFVLRFNPVTGGLTGLANESMAIPVRDPPSRRINESASNRHVFLRVRYGVRLCIPSAW